VEKKIAGLGRETQKFLQFCIEMFRQALMMNYETKALVYFEPKVDKFKLENLPLCQWK
jgi:DNA polymerase-3 subunit delta'